MFTQLLCRNQQERYQIFDRYLVLPIPNQLCLQDKVLSIDQIDNADQQNPYYLRLPIISSLEMDTFFSCWYKPFATKKS